MTIKVCEGPGNRAGQKKRDEQKNDKKTVRTVGDGIRAIHPLCGIPVCDYEETQQLIADKIRETDEDPEK